ncbi:putative Signal transduction histidine kinase [Vibrio nigripulchritudo SO65]|uniref:sensor histidine kinase n=1 Tax=Vibrio nigripulchritudo TaxID=28173 RepID=UPI0003B23095|nr:ATP-binding protein [Vibrio nigripulchritudo]CCN35355.1 putative Signal transduction histidine kinase [Vibrio nigripulchritudo AM115]CCN42667.1 putative Signal transduction histidine kinase [Vibrio nigripulchritudo FTn2]CCN63126.1 putative Signal transduction histidine kinase [Vibrio nigripulchritudo POn4]CCN77331.1 putative Signal transduction histidine kinase [Vibrio nigripulchritudo SO65]
MSDKVEKVDEADKSLSNRILILFIATTTVLIFQGIYNIYSLEGVKTSITQVHDSAFQISLTGTDIAQPASELRQMTMGLVMAPNEQVKEEIKSQISETRDKINKALNGDTFTQFSDEGSTGLLDDISEKWKNYEKEVDKTIEYSNQGVRIAEFLHVTTNEKASYDQLTESIQNFNDYQLGITEAIYTEAQNTSSIAFWSVLLTTIVETIILKVILAYVLSLVKRYVDNKKQHAEELQEKNEALETSIDDLKRVQKQLIESEKMASLNQLVTGVAHEINTPIGIGITASSYFNEQIEKIDQSLQDKTLRPDELKAFLDSGKDSNEVLLSNLKKAAELVQRFKNLSAENIRSETARFDVGTKVSETIRTMSPSLKDVAVNVEYDQSIEIESDPSAIYHSISNLVMNSLNHAFQEEGDHQINIRVESPETELVTIVYSDNGSGISEDKIKNIFDPFYTTNRNKGGTGLGLAIVFNALSQIGGDITCNSEVGVGTTFTMNIKTPVTIRESAA